MHLLLQNLQHYYKASKDFISDLPFAQKGRLLPARFLQKILQSQNVTAKTHNLTSFLPQLQKSFLLYLRLQYNYINSHFSFLLPNSPIYPCQLSLEYMASFLINYCYKYTCILIYVYISNYTLSLCNCYLHICFQG